MKTSILPVILFSLVAIASFSVWAFGARVFPSEVTMYAAIAIIFLGFGGLALLPMSGIPKDQWLPFCLTFAAGFVLYSIIWSVFWFSLPITFGEIMGSALGLLCFSILIRKSLKINISILTITSILFLWHSLGYYTGGFTYAALQNRGPAGIELSASPSTIRTLARLSWGLFYGIGLGIGLTRILHLSRQS
ncbi:MAG: hypothetical protein AAGA96_07560 [Verrucomicrobiota bacterium]